MSDEELFIPGTIRVTIHGTWPFAKYRFGQEVQTFRGGGTMHGIVVARRFIPSSSREWQYQLVDIRDGVADKWCDNHWYPEAALNEVSSCE